MITHVGLKPWLTVSAMGFAILSCGGAQATGNTAPQPSATTAAGATSDALLTQLRAERDDAIRRALDARRQADRDRGHCQLNEHLLASVRERDLYEDGIWSRLDHADIDEGDLREQLPQTRGERRRTLEGILRDVEKARRSVERSVRRVHSVSDFEWPRFKHDLDSELEGLEGVLRSAR